jgi:hypothetical protein
MNRLDPAVFTKLKKIKKLIKLIEGKDSAPAQLMPRIESQITELSSDLKMSDVDQLKTEYLELTQKLKSKTATGERSPNISPDIATWYLRPLVSHFDSPKKINALTLKNEGLGDINSDIYLYLPQEIISTNDEELNSNLNLYYQFKSQGRKKSQHLGLKFYKYFTFTEKNPFPYTTMGKNNLPVFYYNVEKFINNIQSGGGSVIVSGLCPMSGISDEICFVSESGTVWHPKLGFEPLPLPPQGYELAEINFPPKPIFSDYVVIKNYIETLEHLTEKYGTGKIEGLIWYPHQEYLMDFIDTIFINWCEAGLLSKKQIISEFNKLKLRYERIVQYVKSKYGPGTELDLHSTREENLIEYDEILTKLDMTDIKKVYGIWNGPPPRIKLYKYLILKHIIPAMDGINTLHLETSYEIWPTIQGTTLIEKNQSTSYLYSWICYPSTSSISMSYMRDYNAPYKDKIYLAMSREEFELQLQHLNKEYIFYVWPQIFDSEQLKHHIDLNQISSIFINKLNEINKIFN